MKDLTKSFEKVPINNVFLYSFTPSSFFLILERIQLLNRSTLCSIHLVPSTMQKSSVFRRILLPSVLEKSFNFCNLPSLQDFRFTFLSLGGAYKWDYWTSIPWTFFSGVSSHTVSLFSCPCIIWCIVPLQIFVWMHNALNLKLKNTWFATMYASPGQWWHNNGYVQLVHVWEREWKEGRHPRHLLTVLLT